MALNTGGILEKLLKLEVGENVREYFQTEARPERCRAAAWLQSPER